MLLLLLLFLKYLYWTKRRIAALPEVQRVKTPPFLGTSRHNIGSRRLHCSSRYRQTRKSPSIEEKREHGSNCRGFSSAEERSGGGSKVSPTWNITHWSHYVQLENGFPSKSAAQSGNFSPWITKYVFWPYSLAVFICFKYILLPFFQPKVYYFLKI